jgi:hypothetical protein
MRIAHDNDDTAKDEVKYYEVLHNFSQVILRLNSSALNGEPIKNIEPHIHRLIPAFMMLCGVDRDGKMSKQKAGRPKKNAVKPKTVLQSNLLVRNGWGLCPKCSGKCIKVNQDTILVNHPAYCKKCKTESIVTWKYDK